MSRLLRRSALRLRSIFLRARHERELDVELRFHFDMLAAHYRQSGMGARAARRAALQTFGAVDGIKDDVRDTWLSRAIERACDDVRYGVRTLAAAPAFALGLILTIALAVGVNTSVFGIAHSILVRPLPFQDPARLAVLRHGDPAAGLVSSFSLLELADYGRVPGVRAIAELHTMWFILLSPSRADGDAPMSRAPERVSTAVVSPNYFEVLGVRPIAGRSLRETDDRDGAPAVLLLGHAYWQRAFGGDPGVVGRVFEMNDRPHTVVGVLPPFPSYPEAIDVYMPTSACPFRAKVAAAASRELRMSRAIVRLDAATPALDIEANLARTAAALRQRHPASYGDEPYAASAVRLDAEMRQNLRPTLLLLIATAGLVLLIACVSVSNLALARLTHRSEELTLRAALGAARGRIVRQLLTEHLAAVLTGTVLGLVAAHFVVSALTGYVQRSTAIEVDRHLNGGAFVVASVVSVLLLLVSAAVPLVKHREAMTGGVPRQRPGRIRYGLVVGQVGLSFVLTSAAALSVRSLLHLQGIDAGFSTEHVQTMRVDLNFTKYSRQAEITRFWQRLERDLTSVPGVVSAGGAGIMPLDGQQLGSAGFTLEAWSGEAADERFAEEPGRGMPRASLRVASAGYFEALGQPLVEGRAFTGAEASPGRAVVVINQTMARRHSPGTSAVGRRLRLDGSGVVTTVAGVVEDTRQKLDEAPGAEIYLPLFQTAQLSTNWLVRSTLPPDEVERRVRAIVRAIDPEQPVDNFRTLESFRADSLLPSRVSATVVGLFSILALAITTTGIAGVLGYSVQQRRREFGVRLALGAKRSRVVAMVVGDGIRLAAIGLAWGAGASLALAPLMPAVLTGIDSFDAGNFALVSIVLLLAAAAACFVPARRAALVDPMSALRAS